MTTRILTQEELKTQLHYNPETGIFTRLISNSNAIKVGDLAGSKTNTGYLEITILGKRYLSHRLAWLYMTGEFPENLIDHINGVGTNNRFCNLRKANKSENAINSGLKRNNTSGYKGVSFDEKRKLWKANATLNGKKKYLGRFPTAELASQAFLNFAKNNYGEFYYA